MGNKKAIISFSGGLDSTTCLALAKSQGFEPICISFDYNQKHKVELDYAKRLAEGYGAEHKVIEINSNQFATSALVDKSQKVPDFSASEDIPVTYVPARNIIFLSYCLAYAEAFQSYDIFIGVNALDYSGYPDCRPDFISQYEQMANLGLSYTQDEKKLKIHTPLIDLTKAEIIKLGHSLGVDYSKTFSCYNPSPEGKACGKCDSCVLRKKGFDSADK